MVIRIDHITQYDRMGISIRNLKNLSVGNLPSAIDAIRIEAETSMHNYKKIIQKFEIIKDRNEYHISSLVNVPMRFKELSMKEDKPELKDNKIEIYKNIESIIRLQSHTIFFFSSSQDSVIKLSNYIKKLTSKTFNPVPISIGRQNMKKILKNYVSIDHIKFLREGDYGLKRVSFSGSNLLKDKMILSILSNEDYMILEMNGKFMHSSGSYNLYINKNGRIIIKDIEEIDLSDIQNLISTLEEIVLNK